MQELASVPIVYVIAIYACGAVFGMLISSIWRTWRSQRVSDLLNRADLLVLAQAKPRRSTQTESGEALAESELGQHESATVVAPDENGADKARRGFAQAR